MRYIIIALLLGLGANVAFAGDNHGRDRRSDHHRDNKSEKLVFDIGSLAIQLAQTIVQNVKDKDDDTLYVYDENGKLKAVIDEATLENIQDACKSDNDRKVIIRYDWRWPDTRRGFRPMPKPMPRHGDRYRKSEPRRR